VQTVSSTNTAQPTTRDVIAAYTYDGAGNISSSYLQGGLAIDAPVNCKFNELSQMTEYTDSNGVKTTYTYYPNGLRKTKTAGGKTTTYYYDGDNAIIEAENGSLKYRNIYGMNQIARQDAAGNINYFLYNGHGDVVKLVDSAGNIKNRYEYDIYGKVTNAAENGIPNPMRYAGQYYDSESGLYYLRARYYDPRIGRFISEDTYKGKIEDPSTLNLYVYCQGNPIKYNDLSGHIVGTVIGTISGGVVGGVKAALMHTDIRSGIVSGAVSGAIAGAAVDIAVATGGTGAAVIVAAAAGGGVGSFTGDIIDQAGNQLAKGQEISIDLKSAAVSGGVGTVTGAIGGATGVILTKAANQATPLVKAAAENALKYGDAAMVSNTVSSLYTSAYNAANNIAIIDVTTTTYYTVSSNVIDYKVKTNINNIQTNINVNTRYGSRGVINSDY